MTIWLCVIVQTVGEEWFTEFICAWSDCVERFRISDTVTSVVNEYETLDEQRVRTVM